MSRIDFYILPDRSAKGRELLACRLAEKGYRLRHQVYIQAASAEQARLLDDLLWTFQQNSFVPHCLYPCEGEDTPPVLIGWQELSDVPFLPPATPMGYPENPFNSHDQLSETLLINLAMDVPAPWERFGRVAELVNQEQEILEKSRERFRYYRELGCPPKSHKL